MGILIFSGLMLWASGAAAYAAQESAKENAKEQSAWSVSLLALGIYKPEYEGSEDYDVLGFPLINITWCDTVFLKPRKGLGVYILNMQDLQLGLSLGYTFGREEDDSVFLAGLGDIDDGATVNVFMEKKINGFSLAGSYSQQISGHDTGFQLQAGLGYGRRLGRRAFLKTDLKISGASWKYMDEYFSISPDQSAASGLSIYDADAGVKTVGLGITAIYRLTRQWAVQCKTGYERLVGEAADSPVVRDKDQYMVSAGFSYEF